MDAIDAFIAAFAAIDIKAVITVLRLPDDMTVRTVLVLNIAKNHVAVARSEGKAGIIRVLRLDIHKGRSRHGTMQLSDLFEEWARKIDVDPIGKRIPFVAPPFLHVIDWK